MANVHPLKAWRTANRLTQVRAAKILKITQGTYSGLERGARSVRPVTAKRIADKTGVALEVILRVA